MTSILKTNLPAGNGTLALTGSGEFLPPMIPVDRFLMEQLEEPARVAVLPTAAGMEGSERIDYWCTLGEQHFASLGVEWVQGLGVVDVRTANQESWVEKIQAANFVYFSGGKPGYLLNVLRGSKVLQACLEMFARGGVLAGCSAGAMVMGACIPGLLGSAEDGFGFLPESVVIPHFDEFPSLAMRLMPLVTGTASLVGVDGSTALVLSQGKWRVVGRGRVRIGGVDYHESASWMD